MTSAFAEQIGRSLLALVVVVLAGVPLVALAPRRLHAVLLPALPVAGVVAIVVVAHWITLVLPYRVAAWIVAGAAVLGTVLTLAVPRRRPAVRARHVGLAVLLAASALPAVALLNVPARTADAAGLRFTSANHDAFFFSAVDDWFVERRSVDTPDIAASNRSVDSPAVAPVESYESFRRWGEASIQALPASLLGGGTSRHWSMLTSLWLLLLPGAAYLLIRGLGAGAAPAAVAGCLTGLLVCGGGVVLYTVLNQNGPFLLGLPLVVGAAGALALVAGRDRTDLRAVGVASVFLAGWLGTYFELAVIAAPLFLATVLVVRRLPWPAFARSLGLVAGGTALLGLVPLLNAARGLVVVGEARPEWQSFFVDDSRFVVLSKLVGQRSLEDFPVSEPRLTAAATVVLASFWLLAVLTCLWWRPTRWALPAVGVVGAAYWWTQSRGVTNYIANRVVAMTLPVLGLLALGGAVTVVWASSGRTGRLLRPSAVVVAVVAVATGLFSGREQVRSTTDWAVPGRSSTADDVQAASWVAELGGPEGGRVAISTADFVRQLILLDLTREESDVGWSVLRPDYAEQWGFSSERRPRYVLADQGSLVVGGLPVVRSNGRWVLYALEGTGAVLTPPGGMAVGSGPAGLTRWTGAAGLIGVAATPDCAGFDLVLSSAGPPSQAAEIRIGESIDDARVRSLDIGVAQQQLLVPTPGDGTVAVEIRGVPEGSVLDLLATTSASCRPGTGPP